MFNRTLQRPMFRRGGRAGGGIMTGVKRQGYESGNAVGGDLVSADFKTQNTGEKSDMEKVQGNMEMFNKAFPQYPYAASDFFMNLGSNILAQPGGRPILETIGTAAGPALQTLQKTRNINQNSIYMILLHVSIIEKQSFLIFGGHPTSCFHFTLEI